MCIIFIIIIDYMRDAMFVMRDVLTPYFTQRTQKKCERHGHTSSSTFATEYMYSACFGASPLWRPTVRASSHDGMRAGTFSTLWLGRKTTYTGKQTHHTPTYRYIYIYIYRFPAQYNPSIRTATSANMGGDVRCSFFSSCRLYEYAARCCKPNTLMNKTFTLSI